MMLSEYTDEVNRCARVFKMNGVYQVNFWDANMEIDDWKSYQSEDDADDAAEDWVVKK